MMAKRLMAKEFMKQSLSTTFVIQRTELHVLVRQVMSYMLKVTMSCILRRSLEPSVAHWAVLDDSPSPRAY